MFDAEVTADLKALDGSTSGPGLPGTVLIIESADPDGAVAPRSDAGADDAVDAVRRPGTGAHDLFGVELMRARVTPQDIDWIVESVRSTPTPPTPTAISPAIRSSAVLAAPDGGSVVERPVVFGTGKLFGILRRAGTRRPHRGSAPATGPDAGRPRPPVHLGPLPQRRQPAPRRSGPPVGRAQPSLGGRRCPLPPDGHRRRGGESTRRAARGPVELPTLRYRRHRGGRAVPVPRGFPPGRGAGPLFRRLSRPAGRAVGPHRRGGHPQPAPTAGESRRGAGQHRRPHPGGPRRFVGHHRRAEPGGASRPAPVPRVAP